MKNTLPLLVYMFFALCLNSQEQEKKVIYLGTDAPFTRNFSENVAQLEADNVPIDGTAINYEIYVNNGFLRAFNSGFAGTPEDMFLPGPWQMEFLDQSTAYLTSVTPEKIKHNFIRFQSRPGNVDWFDDQGWIQIVDNFRYAAIAAREGNLEGIMFDPEPYTEPFAQFDYFRQSEYSLHSFDQYYEKARQRGREVMTAIQEEYPDITMLNLFLNSYALAQRFRGPSAFGLDDPKLALHGHSYALLPAFLDGWLDVAGPELTIVDGNEESYYYTQELDFETIKYRMEVNALDMVSRDLQDTYDSNVQPGAAVFMDSYDADLLPFPFPLELGAGESYPELFQKNLSTALRTSQEYVWLYGETGGFWPANVNGQDSKPAWDDILPWMTASIAFGKEPENWPAQTSGIEEEVEQIITTKNRIDTWGRERYKELLQTDSLISNNLIDNSSFESNIAGWGFFQNENLNQDGEQSWSSEGSQDMGSLKVIKSRRGSSFISFEVAPGDIYYFSADVKRIGWGEPKVLFSYRDNTSPNNTFLRFVRQSLFYEAYDPVDPTVLRETSWTPITGIVTVPEKTNNLVLSMIAEGQRLSEDEMLFDNIILYKVGENGEGPDITTIENPTGLPNNYSFENGLEGWTASQGVVQVVNDAFSGGYAAKIGKGSGGVNQRYNVTPGDTYSASFYAKLIGAPSVAAVGLIFRDASGATFNDSFDTTIITENSYQEYSFSGVVPENTSQLEVVAWKDDGERSFMLVDAINLDIVRDDTTPRETITVKNKVTGTYLRPENDLDDSKLIVTQDDGSDIFRWEKVPTSDDYFYLKNKETGKYFRPKENRRGAPLQQKPTTFDDNWTQWREELSPDGNTYFLVNRNTTQHIRPGINAPGAEVFVVPGRWQGNWVRWEITSSDSNRSSSTTTLVAETNTSLKVFPNPASNVVEITFNNEVSREKRIEIYNSNGQRVLSKHLKSQSTDASISLDIENLISGIYTIKVVMEGKNPIVAKLIKK